MKDMGSGFPVAIKWIEAWWFFQRGGVEEEEGKQQYEEVYRATSGFTSEFLYRKEGTMLQLTVFSQWEEKYT